MSLLGPMHRRSTSSSPSATGDATQAPLDASAGQNANPDTALIVQLAKALEDSSTDVSNSPTLSIAATRAGAILALYRSAVNVGEEWATEFREVAPPGLVLAPTDDLYISAERSRQGSERSGAKLAELPGLGHWWMLQAPEVAASILRAFWSAL